MRQSPHLDCLQLDAQAHQGCKLVEGGWNIWVLVVGGGAKVCFYLAGRNTNDESNSQLSAGHMASPLGATHKSAFLFTCQICLPYIA